MTLPLAVILTICPTLKAKQCRMDISQAILLGHGQHTNTNFGLA